MAMPQQKPPPTKPAEPRPKRSFLAAVTSGKIDSPDRTLLLGTEGVGKTSFAAKIPGVVFMPVEAGTNQIALPARLPKPETWQDAIDMVEELRTSQAHSYKALAIDTVDALEALCWDFICKRDNMKSVEDYGFGKGYAAALDEWRRFIAELERLWRDRDMQIVLIAHTHIRTFKNPEGEDYDRYELKLNAKAGGLLKEWSDAVLFARFEELPNKDPKTKRVRGVSTGMRVMHTVRTAAYDAKNRFSLPETMPFSYPEYAAARAGQSPARARELGATIAAQLEQLQDAEKRAQIAEYVAGVKDDIAQLVQVTDRLTALLAEQTPVTEENANV